MLIRFIKSIFTGLVIVNSFFSLAVAKNTKTHIYLNTNGNIIVNQLDKTIAVIKPLQFQQNGTKFYADNLTAWYQSLQSLDLQHINKIEAIGNIRIFNNFNHVIITADKYVYSLTQAVHVLMAKQHPVIYKDGSRTLIAKDRVEYFIQPNVVVVRGAPYILGKSNNSSKFNYKFGADLFNIQLNKSNNSTGSHNNHTINFAEAVNHVYFRDNNNTSITANYAIYYKEQNQIEFYNNVVLKNNFSQLKSCAAVYNIKLGYGKLIPCSKQELKGYYKKSNHNG